MVDASRHPNVEIISYAEVERVDGYIGNFKATVHKKPRRVDIERCNGCGECVAVCPIEVPNDYEMNLAPRKAIYVPHSQAVPLRYVVDEDACIHCYKCVEACGDLQAIDFSLLDEEVELDVGAIVVATGFTHFDPTAIEEYGYGRYENVITAMEMERLHNSAGPTAGDFVRPSDHKNPKNIALIQCVGSRDKRYHEYCSGFCCMYTIKNAILLKQMYHDIDITIFYMDIRTPSKGYEEFYNRARNLGIRFIRGRPSQITEDPVTRNLFVRAEDQELGELIELETEMVALSAAAEPQPDTAKVSQTLTIPTSPSGFFMEYHPKLRPIDTPAEGVFLAGAAQGVKDIPASVAQGSAAAARAARILTQDEWQIEPIVAYVWPDRCINAEGKKCGICATKCPYNAIQVTRGDGKPAVVQSAMCHGCGACVAECPHNAITQMHYTDAQILSQIHAMLADKPEEKLLSLRCHWCSYGAADMAGLSHFEYPANERGIRVMCSGRMDTDFILEGFRMGAGGILASG